MSHELIAGMSAGAMLMYLAVGAFIWLLALREGWMTRRWLGLLLYVLLWPIWLMDVTIEKQRKSKGD